VGHPQLTGAGVGQPTGAEVLWVTGAEVLEGTEAGPNVRPPRILGTLLLGEKETEIEGLKETEIAGDSVGLRDRRSSTLGRWEEGEKDTETAEGEDGWADTDGGSDGWAVTEEGDDGCKETERGEEEGGIATEG
jgi:hypothetical protein